MEITEGSIREAHYAVVQDKFVDSVEWIFPSSTSLRLGMLLSPLIKVAL